VNRNRVVVDGLDAIESYFLTKIEAQDLPGRRVAVVLEADELGGVGAYGPVLLTIQRDRWRSTRTHAGGFEPNPQVIATVDRVVTDIFDIAAKLYGHPCRLLVTVNETASDKAGRGVREICKRQGYDAKRRIQVPRYLRIRRH
jgi:hypothetical protein